MAFEVFESGRGRFRWQYRAENGRVVSTSDGSYPSRGDAERAIETFKTRINASETTSGTKPRGPILGESLKTLVLPAVLALFAATGSYLGVRAGVEGDIKVKAADIAFAGTPTLADVQGRMSTLARLFPTELKEWGPEASADSSDYLFVNANSARWAFLQLAMQKVSCADQVAELWSDLFGPDRVRMSPGAPNDTWITAVKPLTPCPAAAAPTPSAH